MVAEFTLPATARVIIQFSLTLNNRGCFGCGERRTFVNLKQNVVGGSNIIAGIPAYTPNNELINLPSGIIVLNLGAGTYSYKITLQKRVYGTATVYNGNNNQTQNNIT